MLHVLAYNVSSSERTYTLGILITALPTLFNNNNNNNNKVSST